MQMESNCLSELKIKIKGDGNLEWCKDLLTDTFLLHFIRGRKYNVDRAHHTLLHYFQIRKVKNRDFFLKVIPSQLRLNSEWPIGKLLKLPSPNGRLVMVTCLEWYPGPGKFTMDDVIQKSVIIGETLWKRKEAEIEGIEIILECTGYNWNFIRISASVNVLLKWFNIFLDAFPLRYKKVHCIKLPGAAKIVYNIASMVAPKKLMERMIIHKDLDSLHEDLPKSMLPKFLGGDLEDDEAYDLSFEESMVSSEEYYRNFKQMLLN